MKSIVKYTLMLAMTMSLTSYSQNKTDDKTTIKSSTKTANANSQEALRIDNLHFGPKQQEAKGKVLDQIVAIVGNDVIAKSEIASTTKELEDKKLQELIYRKLLLQEAKKYNIQIGDTALNLKLEEIAKQNKETLVQLQQKAQTKGGYAKYRETIREDLTISRLQQAIANQFVKITNREIEDFVEKRLKQVNDSVNLEDILIKVPQTNDEAELNKAQKIAATIIEKLKTEQPQTIAAGYQGNVQYNKLGWVDIKQIPVSFSRVLINLPVNTYAKPIIDRDGIHILKIIDRKGATKEGISFKEVKVSHILIKSNDKDKNKDNAKTRIDNIYQKLLAGADFAETARYYSEDQGSAVRGGDLDWVTPGRMVPEFEAVMKNTPIGKISKPFKSQFGWHILIVYDIREISLSNDETLKQQAKQMIFQSRASEEWQLWLTRLRDESYVKIL